MSTERNKMAYTPNPEEKKLVEGCLNNRASEQKELYERYYGKMLGVCLRYAVDRDDAKDILQDGFVKIFQNISTFTFSSPLEVWMRRVMVNTAIDKYRKNALTPIHQDIDMAGQVSVDDDILGKISADELLKCINAMPDGYRMVFNMYIIEGFSHKEIGEKLNISEGTSKSQLSKARAYLQKMIKGNYSNINE